MNNSTDVNKLNKQTSKCQKLFTRLNQTTDSDIQFTMEASQVFLNLLRSIEDSQLNYAISRTPFSATISLKSSFFKRFAEASKKSDLENVKNLPRTDSHLEKKVEETEAEKVALQEEIHELQDTFEKEQKRIMGELVNIQKVYEEEKKRSAALEIEIVNNREEALKIKKERKELEVVI